MRNGSGACWMFALAMWSVVAAGISAAAATRCDRLLGRLANQVVNAADTTCFESPDLTPANPSTTPADNSLGLPVGAFTPRTDRTVVSPTIPTTINKKVPGLQLD